MFMRAATNIYMGGMQTVPGLHLGGLFIWQNKAHIYMQRRWKVDVLKVRWQACWAQSAMAQTKALHSGQGELDNYNGNPATQLDYWIFASDVSSDARKHSQHLTRPIGVIKGERGGA